jgi:hypothetical protein
MMRDGLQLTAEAPSGMKKNIHKPSMTKGFQIKFQLEAQKTKSYV